MSARTSDRTLHYTVALDNHSITRDFGTGYGTHYPALDDGRQETIVIHDIENFRNAYDSNYIIDDGRTVSVWYVAGWNDNAPNSLWVQPFPTNPTGAVRPDNGLEIDYATWALGPRRTYHLKVTWTEETGA